MDDAAHALIRFGLGRRAGEPLPADPRQWLLAQLAPGDPVTFPGLPDTTAALVLLQQDRAAKARDPQAAAQVRIAATAWRQDAAAQLDAAVASPAPFRERLVWFWANHFTVSTRRGIDAALIGPFIREAIRPHVTGRFRDMLLAVMRHPAMLLYLDNATSVGPHSRVGLKRHRGLNENLARESLELHTVTPAAGYTQADVTAYAAILTGWSVELNGPDPGFRFRPETAQPGAKVLLGRRFEDGEAGGIAALRFLAGHPATCQSLARKLARHFIGDAPAAAAVNRLARLLWDTDGDLAAAAAALVAEPAAWRPLTKLRSPLDYTVAVLRAAGPRDDARSDGESLIGVLNALGQPLWGAPLPNGWPDTDADWDDPETMLRRADWAYRLSGRLGDADARTLAVNSLGGLLQSPTRRALAHAASRREALTLLFTSPEFMRR